jgi:hypothetical protein
LIAAALSKRLLQRRVFNAEATRTTGSTTVRHGRQVERHWPTMILAAQIFDRASSVRDR